MIFKIFHNVVLSSGSVPLSVLEEMVNAYIANGGEIYFTQMTNKL